MIDLGDNGPVLALGAHTTQTGIRLATGERYETPLDDAPDVRRLGQRSETSETTVVAVEDAPRSGYSTPRPPRP